MLASPRPAVALAQKVEQTCSGINAWEQVRALYGSASVFAQNACANATFILGYLYGPESLAMREEQVTAANEIEGQPMAWARGAALLAATGS